MSTGSVPDVGRGKVVLGLGTSHTPMLLVEPDDYQRFHEWDERLELLDHDGVRRTLPELHERAGDRFSREMDPWVVLDRHCRAQRAIDQVAGVLRAHDVDVAIVVGDDQRELFGVENQPALLTYTGDALTVAPVPEHIAAKWPGWMGSAMTKYYGDEPVSHPAAPELACHLVESVGRSGFDLAVSTRLPDHRGEGHAFAFVHTQIMRDAVVPVVPVFINTYYPPNQPTPERCYSLGRAIRDAVESYQRDVRVAIIASGGLSHFVVDESFDERIITALREADGDTLIGLPLHKLNSGSSEIRNWICVAGAVKHLELSWLEYIPAYRSLAGTGTGLCFASWTVASSG